MKSHMNSRMKTRFGLILLGVSIALAGLLNTALAASDESDVRSAVQHIFDQLKNGQYEAVYDSLPSSSRSRISKERLVQGLRRSQNMFQLQRIDIGPARVSGNIAVVDTTMYAHVTQPFDADGVALHRSIIRLVTPPGASAPP